MMEQISNIYDSTDEYQMLLRVKMTDSERLHVISFMTT